ncbi:hypothetical protein Adu01nite_23910 [Paractinoplanes durhamensis]|uniref:Uncharacterized protein n=1 Tax=Paractinoplanes durhamensis TaxID=113563 RepID=A0ABQ3YU05_9ACTN|nr:hypothetical protein Adu01nite_23910 [Actinoplanes durhamensis]
MNSTAELDRPPASPTYCGRHRRPRRWFTGHEVAAATAPATATPAPQAGSAPATPASAKGSAPADFDPADFDPADFDPAGPATGSAPAGFDPANPGPAAGSTPADFGSRLVTSSDLAGSGFRLVNSQLLAA